MTDVSLKSMQDLCKILDSERLVQDTYRLMSKISNSR